MCGAGNQNSSPKEKDRRPAVESAPVVVYSISDIQKRNHPTFCGPIAVYALSESGLLHSFLFVPCLHLLTDSSSVAVTLVLGSILMAVHCTVGTGKSYGQGREMRSQLLISAGQLCLAVLCLMRPAKDMHISGHLTGADAIAHLPRQHFWILAVLFLAFVALRSLLVLRARRAMPLCEPMAQPVFFAFLFNYLFLCHSTKVFQTSSLNFSLSSSLAGLSSLDN